MQIPRDCERQRRLVIIEGFSFTYQSSALFKTRSDDEDKLNSKYLPSCLQTHACTVYSGTLMTLNTSRFNRLSPPCFCFFNSHLRIRPHPVFLLLTVEIERRF